MATWPRWSLCHHWRRLASVVRPMGGGDRLKASRAGNGEVVLASNGSKTAPTPQFSRPTRVAAITELRKGTVDFSVEELN